MTQKRTISLPDDVHGLLDRVGNASGYLAELVERAWRAWQESLHHLRAIGWTDSEIRCACDVLNGHLVTPGVSLGEDLALSLGDAARLNKTHARWGVGGETWAERVLEVRDQEPVARALWVVVQEFWAGNEELARRVGA